MPVRFELFRVSLMVRPQADLFVADEHDRETFLRRVFLTPYKFEYRGIPFQYLPYAVSVGPNVLGAIGRERVAVEDVPTADGFQEDVHIGWKASLLALDPTNSEDGQKIALQIDIRVGAPASLIDALVAEINRENPRALYNIEVQPIFDGRTFWQFAKEHENKITELTFDLVVPNGFWNASKSVKEEMRDAKERLRAQRVTNTVRSKDGLNTDDEGVRDAVEYAESGSGSIRAKTKEGRRFNSKSKTRTSTLDEVDESESLVASAMLQLDQVFDRE